jgi:hypothetical protein
MKIATGAFAVILFIVIVGGLYLLSAWFFALLWNFVMAGVFHLPTLTIWHALAIQTLLWIVGSYFKSTNKK